MGLDQYAYVAAKAGTQDAYWNGATFNEATGDWENADVTKPRDIAYWRKHPNLQGWMETLWEQKMQAAGEDNPHNFNGIELELTWEDIDQLEKDLKSGSVRALGTTGFFFGDPSDDHYREKDLEFVKKARAELFLGLKVF